MFPSLRANKIYLKFRAIVLRAVVAPPIVHSCFLPMCKGRHQSRNLAALYDVTISAKPSPLLNYGVGLSALVTFVFFQTTCYFIVL